jgi:mRNA interferase YafQ
MLKYRFSNAIEKDIALMSKGGYDVVKLVSVVRLLVQDIVLPVHFRDHPLKGKWAGSRECHLSPDWIMIYRKDGDTLILERTGTHSDLLKI